MTSEDVLRQRVEAGANWLDKAEPGWADRIDLDRLDMGSFENCVAGQVGEEYCDFCVGHSLTTGDEVRLGFYLTLEAHESLYLPDGRSRLSTEYAILDELWADAVRARTQAEATL